MGNTINQENQTIQSTSLIAGNFNPKTKKPKKAEKATLSGKLVNAQKTAYKGMTKPSTPDWKPAEIEKNFNALNPSDGTISNVSDLDAKTGKGRKVTYNKNSNNTLSKTVRNNDGNRVDIKYEEYQKGTDGKYYTKGKHIIMKKGKVISELAYDSKNKAK